MSRTYFGVEEGLLRDDQGAEVSCLKDEFEGSDLTMSNWMVRDTVVHPARHEAVNYWVWNKEVNAQPGGWIHCLDPFPQDQ